MLANPTVEWYALPVHMVTTRSACGRTGQVICEHVRITRFKEGGFRQRLHTQSRIEFCLICSFYRISFFTAGPDQLPIDDYVDDNVCFSRINQTRSRDIGHCLSTSRSADQHSFPPSPAKVFHPIFLQTREFNTVQHAFCVGT